MNTKNILSFYLAAMALFIVGALLFPGPIHSGLNHPELYAHAKFVHVLTVTLFFAQTVIGSVWELQSLRSRDTEIIRYTYQTVIWMDAVLTAPLVLVSVTTGILLGTVIGGVWSVGWVSWSLLVFLATGVLWLVADIPMQYRIKKLFASVERGAPVLPEPLRRALRLRMGINLGGVVPLLGIFFLMVHKPDLPKPFSGLGGWGIRSENRRPLPPKTSRLPPE